MSHFAWPEELLLTILPIYRCIQDRQRNFTSAPHQFFLITSTRRRPLEWKEGRG